MTDRPVLYVCLTCRAGQPLPADGVPPGEHLHAAMAARATSAVEVRPIKCLSACDDGCTMAISMPGKWTYLLGRLDPSLAGDLLAYAETYAASATGGVMPRRRPASLANVILGRTPGVDQVLA